MSDTISILIADDHPIVRAGFRSILEGHDGINIVGEAGSGDEIFASYKEVQPDIIVLDLTFPVSAEDESPTTAGGFEVLRNLSRKHPETQVIVVTMVDRAPIPARVIDLGAKGYIVKSSAVNELLEAVITVHEGGTYLSESIRSQVEEVDEGTPSKLLAKLTRKELEVFMHLAAGEAPAEIGTKMNLSHKTIHAHRASILKKLNLKSNTDLVRFGISSGIIYP